MANLLLNKNKENPMTLKAGSIVFGQGEPPKYLYILKRGVLRLIKEKGQRLSVVKICNEREILNEVSVLTNQPTVFSAIAKTDVEIVLVEQKDILSVINNGPKWIPDIFSTLCERLKSTQDIIEQHNLLSTEKNAEMLLTKDEEKRYITALAEYKSH
jgi:CRP/FNR family transcriptional regulator